MSMCNSPPDDYFLSQIDQNLDRYKHQALFFLPFRFFSKVFFFKMFFNLK